VRKSMSIAATPPTTRAISEPVVVKIVLRQVSDTVRAIVAVVVPTAAVPAARTSYSTHATYPANTTGSSDTPDSTHTADAPRPTHASRAAYPANTAGFTDTSDSTNSSGPARTAHAAKTRKASRPVRGQLRWAIAGETAGSALGRHVEEVTQVAG
jgi:hypothetical protein